VVKMPGVRSHGSGRVHPHQRDTDDGAPTIGSTLILPSDLNMTYNETAKHDMTDACRINYRQRIARIIKFWKKGDPDYYAVGVREVSQDELLDETRYYFGRFKEDLIYIGMNSEFLKHFLVKIKWKLDGKLKGVDDLRKYKDAVMWGAKTAGMRLPTSFYEMIDKFLGGLKKEYVAEKKKGNVDENSADPITLALFKLLLQWALDCNNIFVWFWTLSQWAFMARSASIDPLRLDNFRLGPDSIIGKYDDSKSDKAAERLSEKNLYSNPTKFQWCWWTGFGVWVALRGEDAFKDDCHLFLNAGAKPGTESTNYCEQVLSVVAPHMEELMQHIAAKRFNPYGLRKGSATHAVSGTTQAPSLPSIARRGEWSIGTVLDVYWHFGSVGDNYLGRILALLDPNSQDFDSLPPHWRMICPMENAEVSSKLLEIYFASRH
jgi:hypothetical protein